MIKNDLILKALKGEKTERTPVWMMRQAGRFLPEYRALREKYSFFERCQNPELACEITMQPIRRLGVDAAILFSDILVVPQAMGMEVQLVESVGPILPQPLKTAADLDRICVPDVHDRLHYVAEAIQHIKQELNNEIPLIGFAGAPWTLLCYMVQGKGSKTFDEAKGFCYQNPELADTILQKITDTTIAYLKMQIEAGADLVQIFDSWGGLLSPQDFERFSLKYMRQIVKALEGTVPVIMFAKGAWQSLREMADTGAHGLGIDWCIRPEFARYIIGPYTSLQGNYDPAQLLAPIPEIIETTKAMLKSFGPGRHIANLGHGILPHVPVDHAQAFIDTVKNYQFN